MRDALIATLGLLLIACAGGDLPAPSAATDPANPKGPVTPFEAGANELTNNLSAAPGASSSSHPAAAPPSKRP